MEINLVDHQTSRDEQAQRSQEHIIETALNLFAAHGYNGVSTRKIAKAAGVAEGLIFHYFPKKADLLLAVIETRHSFVGELRDLLKQAHGHSAQDVLPEIAQGWLKTLYHEQAITMVLLMTAQIDLQVSVGFQALIDEGTDLLEAYLETCVEAGELRGDLSLKDSALMFFSGLLVFFLRYKHLPLAEWDQKAESYVKNLISVWLNGAMAD